MAEGKQVNICALNGTNYPTWKIQCQMVLIREGLWGIVNKTEECPNQGTEADKYAKYQKRRDRALATIVLAVDPSLLYLIGDPEDPAVVWEQLTRQFQKKTWANKLCLRKRLYSMKLAEGGSMKDHVKNMTEIFRELAVVAEPVSEEDQVVHLLASLPDSYDVLVTAMESGAETVPPLETVTEKLLREEQKLREREGADDGRKILVSQNNPNPKKKLFPCHYCGKLGHFKKECRKFAQAQAAEKGKPKRSQGKKQSNQDAMLISHALSARSSRNWVVDSGATCHMSNDRSLFAEMRELPSSEKVTLGDGHDLEATGEGTVNLEMLLPDGNSRSCALQKVLFVPKLAYNLVSVSRATQSGKTVKFDSTGCTFVNSENEVTAFATKQGSLFYLEVCRNSACAAKGEDRLWHRRYGHLSEESLKKLVRGEMVNRLDYDVSGGVGICESCIGGKQCKSSFSLSTTQTSEPLELVHSDLCGKMGKKSLGGAEYFLTFLDDKTHYTWVYALKTKDQVYSKFKEWKAEVETRTGKRIKTLRTDNGGEYTSKEFQAHLKACGIRHELTIPKTPEQNGVAERLNRTLVEMTRAMLLDSKLPQSFWAEAVSTAAYLRNRSPTSAVEGMTPHEAWYGCKPGVEHLRVFGSTAYVHTPKDSRGKLDSKTSKCILVGYGSVQKGYRLYNREAQKILHSRDVKFDEGEKVTQQVVLEEEAEAPTRKVDTLVESLDEEESDTEEERVAETEPRKSSRERRPTDFYGQRVNLSMHAEPTTLEEARSSPEKQEWNQAMEKEMKSLKDNDVWELTALPPGKKAIGSKWVYKVKTGGDGSIERYKARLVAQGFNQKYGSDYDETFCPVVRQESLRTLIALSTQNGLLLHQVDVTTAFLNGTLEEEVYMRQPKGFIRSGEENLVCKLSKSIYGLKQSPRCWNSTLDAQLGKMGFKQTKSDPCIYVSTTGRDPFYIGVYVDDMVMAGKDEASLQKVKDELGTKFEIKDLGKLKYFLGMTIVQNQEEQSTWMGQPDYTTKLLEKHGMSECKPVATPVDPGTHLTTLNEKEEVVDQQQYQSVVGSLMYLSVCTRPDIAYAVGTLARYSSKPGRSHWTAVKRVLRYLKGTTNHGIVFRGGASGNIVGYSDADWAGDREDRKSTSGYLFQIAGGPISWRSKKQDTVALSTAEAEYVALSSAAQETVWLRRLISELNNPPDGPTTILEDNQSAMAMAKNPQFHGR